MARTLSGLGFLGTHMIAFTPNIFDAKAMDWPWFPVEAVTTPRRLSSSLSWLTRLIPPLILNAHVGW
ncbi:MAG: hypothetical protein Q8O47_03330 [Candidatus Bathyarchaeota archaeon]|nr:hypothetical protein [Candidatus Bathyarchaeota archaeon]